MLHQRIEPAQNIMIRIGNKPGESNPKPRADRQGDLAAPKNRVFPLEPLATARASIGN